MDTRGRRIVRSKTEGKFHYLLVAKDYISSFILHALSLAIVATFLIWVLNQV
ncbi:hypothetical protein [Sutcliffiella halmapala]|uniref:hypothetical protein n=1 Tax=Sutcliffiella halmapala TaxID=79882 RepID=UPI0014760577|nr:hypothetical protein [Sutcliffiella halmapala]